MYNIMLAKSKRNNYGSLYQFMTCTVDGEVTPLEIETKEDLDTRIEKMLNSGGYSKSDFIVVEVVDYTIDATDYTDDDSEADESETTDTEDDTSETTESGSDDEDDDTETEDDSETA